MTDIKTRPIIFNSDMARAILEGRITQTRRVIKNWPPKINVLKTIRGISVIKGGKGLVGKPGIHKSISNKHGALSININGQWLGVKPAEFEWVCPFGVPGDRLWVRETFTEVLTRPFDNDSGKVVYRADGWEGSDPDYPVKWKPSIHMPRKFSRITLEITDLRVERVQNISPEDILAEGVITRVPISQELSLQKIVEYSQEYFAELWDSINAKRGYSWESNPWVWVVEFEVCK